MPLHLGFEGDVPYHLDADRLTTHGVVLGMTGSGKTGLCVDLLEEAALTGVPVLIVDPKGDLAHFGRPWPEEASERWVEGLKASGVPDAKVDALRSKVDVRVRTPGSTSGVPVNVLDALRAPSGADDEALAEAAATASGALLGLAGIEGEAHRDPRRIVATQVVLDAFRKGDSISAEQFVLRFLDPGFEKVGVFPLETFLSREDRMDVALALNGVLAAPSFAAWTRGDPIDLDAWLRPTPGATPVTVLYLAHLDDSARRFFVTLLLGQLVAWSRRQSGSDALRALLFFDEVMGFMPPHPRNPPSKGPLLTLMKQARAVGLGVVLCTQNPVDLDYKALSNAGWWAVGRLTTAQDRERVLDGMTAIGINQGELSDTIGTLPPWSFAVRDVREGGITVVRSRWAITWLGGPVTLSQLRAWKGEAPSPAASLPTSSAPSVRSVPVAAEPELVGLPEPPPVPSSIAQRWVDPAVRRRPSVLEVFGAAPAVTPGKESPVHWRPALLARVSMRFDERGFAHDREAWRLFWPLEEGGEPRRGDDVAVLQEGGVLLEGVPAGGRYDALPVHLDEAKEIRAFQKGVVEDLLRGETTQLFKHPATKLKSTGGETREAFQARVTVAVQERIDARVAKLRDKVEAAVERLDAKRDKLERSLVQHQSDAQARLATEVVNAGETLFGMLFGGRNRSLTTAMTKRQATSRAKLKASDAEAQIRDLDRDLYDAESELRDDIQAIENEERRTIDDIDVTEVGLEKDDVRVEELLLVWVE